ncbi:Scn11a, partial [Symbiodinium microadriaticum]
SIGKDCWCERQGQLEKIVASVDLDGNGLISHKEMKAILQDKDAVRALHSVGVDPVSLVDLADVLFPTKVAEDGDEFRGEMTFIQFMQELLELRGKNTATVKDMITLRKIMKVQQEDLLEAIGQLESSVLGSADELQQTAQRKQGSRRNLESPEREQLSPTLSQQPRVLEGQLIDEELSQKMLELRQILDATLSSVILNGRSIDKPIESRDPAAGALRATAAEESVCKPGKHEDLFLEDVPGMQELEALERVLSQRHLQAEKPRQQLLPGQPRGVSSDI